MNGISPWIQVEIANTEWSRWEFNRNPIDNRITTIISRSFDPNGFKINGSQVRDEIKVAGAKDAVCPPSPNLNC